MTQDQISALLELHPLPWRIVDDCHFSDASPLTVLDANGDAVLAIAGHASMLDDTDARDHVVAGSIVTLVHETAAHVRSPG